MLETVVKDLSLMELRGLRKAGERISRTGIAFAVCSKSGEVLVLSSPDTYQPDPLGISQAAIETIHQWDLQKDPVKTDSVWSADVGDHYHAVVLTHGCEAIAVMIIDSGSDHAPQAAAYLDEILRLMALNFQAESQAEMHIDKVSNELSLVYEELVLLHKLSTNMKVTETDANFLQMACDNLTDIINVEGIAILLEKTIDEDKRLVLAAGSGLIDVDERMIAMLHNRLTDALNGGNEALLDSDVDGDFKYEWPANIHSIIAVPLTAKENDLQDGLTHSHEHTMGLMVAINRLDKPDFDSIDVKLFNSVANGCAVFIENGRLFTDLKELFIGALKALANSIDAKDKYTRGHSERVAFISRWIAERLAEKGKMDYELVHRVYLAGLLHDIGKMGIDESVLRKDGKLSDDEYGQIQKHPSIGASILSAIKQMKDIVPGVLYHHERVDGRGYPDGLNQDQLPLMSKIIGLADSFDAMTSRRTYRDAMSLEKAIAEIKEGMGTQFDEEVARIFLESDIYRLWNVLQDGFYSSDGSDSFMKYGTVAVGALIR